MSILEKAENPEKSRLVINSTIMKKYSKPKVLAKNSPAGSYAAGCSGNIHTSCHFCEYLN